MSGPRRLFQAAGVGLGALVAAHAFSAYTAANTVPTTMLGRSSQSMSASSFEPSACTGTVSAIVNVPSGGTSFTVSTANNLILGTSGNDNVTATSGYNCFVGGGPVSGNKDKFTGPAGGGDQCIVASSDSSSNIKNCTIVQRSP
jgi:hypothetical protein